ncbi:MAG TPA: glucose-6-phosphate dehydrogenase [Gemmatimonadaceae bacterium]|nr:glucose-6-phosphate dehydrogenase [Gemmatimonadaceae bacterium]
MTAPLVAECALEAEHAAAPPSRRAGPCTMIIFGASGDLTRRKLIPALAHLDCDGLLDASFAVIGVGRSGNDGEFRRAMREAIDTAEEVRGTDPAARARFISRLRWVAGDLEDGATYRNLAECLRAIEGEHAHERGRLFYLAIPPSLYPDVIRRLSSSGLAPRVSDDRAAWVRIIIEKPFGHDEASARELDRLLNSAFSERQVFRIDHYLGKETVQNLLVLRFANSLFEPIWNRDHVEQVQITACESVGVEHRASYYEEAGVLRDMFQNHLLQLLTLTAMEPPNTFAADAVRNEKTKVLGAIRPITPELVPTVSAIGQYATGAIDGTPVRGYREEPGVSPTSRVPTFAALRLEVANWRWEGVPFFLRSGKRMPRRATEIAIRFRRPPHLMFPLRDREALEPNVLVIRIQPNEGISLRFEVKVPGVDVRLAPVRMLFSYADAFGTTSHSAYETLLLDCMLGDATLFTRADAVEAAWHVIDPVIEGWARLSGDIPTYEAGSWGPAAAHALIARDGARWREP